MSQVLHLMLVHGPTSMKHQKQVEHLSILEQISGYLRLAKASCFVVLAPPTACDKGHIQLCHIHLVPTCPQTLNDAGDMLHSEGVQTCMWISTWKQCCQGQVKTTDPTGSWPQVSQKGQRCCDFRGGSKGSEPNLGFYQLSWCPLMLPSH